MDESQALTWAQLVRLEPGLGQLRLDCRFADHREPNGFSAEAAWNGTAENPGLKQRLEQFVGPKAERQDACLQSLQAYELAVAECHEALPPNRQGIGGLNPQTA
jgi:hypothetical protein